MIEKRSIGGLKSRTENRTEKHDQNVIEKQFKSAIKKCDQEVQFKKCNSKVRSTSAVKSVIEKCN